MNDQALPAFIAKQQLRIITLVPVQLLHGNGLARMEWERAFAVTSYDPRVDLRVLVHDGFLDGALDTEAGFLERFGGSYDPAPRARREGTMLWINPGSAEISRAEEMETYYRRQMAAMTEVARELGRPLRIGVQPNYYDMVFRDHPPQARVDAFLAAADALDVHVAGRRVVG